MEDKIKAISSTEVKKLPQPIGETVSRQQQKEEVKTSLWDEAKTYTEGAYEGFIEVLKESFEWDRKQTQK